MRHIFRFWPVPFCAAVLVTSCDDGDASSSQGAGATSGGMTTSISDGGAAGIGQGGASTGGNGTGGTTTTANTSTSTGGNGSGGGAGGPALQHVWSKRFGDAANQRVRAAAVAPNNDIVLCGDFTGNLDFGGGNLAAASNTRLFLARLDGAGNHKWSAAFGDGSAGARDIVVDSTGNVFVTGEFNNTLNMGGSPLIDAGGGDIFLAKFSPEGTHLWSKRFGDATQQFSPSIAVDSTGAVVAAGLFEGTLNFGGTDLLSNGTNDLYVAKFNSDGSHVWSVRSGDTGNQRPDDVAIDQSNNIYLVGGFTGVLDFSSSLTSLGNVDAFLVKLDANANYLWGKRFGDSGLQEAFDVSTSPSGSVAIAGSFEGTIDLGGGTQFSPGYNSSFLAEYDSTGAYLWSTTNGSVGSEHFGSIGRTADSGIALAGPFWGTLDIGGTSLQNQGTGADIFVALLDSQGMPGSAKSFGSAAYDSATEVVMDNAGALILAASVEGPADFGGGVLPYAGGMDVVLTKYDP